MGLRGKKNVICGNCTSPYFWWKGFGSPKLNIACFFKIFASKLSVYIDNDTGIEMFKRRTVETFCCLF